MQYRPFSGVWEITMNCNMRCKHCGSSCEHTHSDELTTEEALALCDSLRNLGMQRITLSGGEAFTRKDWPQIVERLSKNGISTNILSNGWFIDGDTVDKALAAGVRNIGISLDGLEETHDYIRKKTSFSRIMSALDILADRKRHVGIVTCIHGKNFDELPQIKELLIKKGVSDWQLQAAVPMGNMLNHPEWILDASHMDKIIDFAYETLKEGRINVHLADDIGYFNLKEIEIRRAFSKSDFYKGIWNGCPAGKDIIGVRCNGDIIGCLSIRDDNYIEGNVRETPLQEIWDRPGAFAWNRDMTKDKLTGFCKTCQYGAYCLGGCAGTKLTRYNSVGENKFCSYRIAVEKRKEDIIKINDFPRLVGTAREMVKEEEYQLAEIYISKALETDPQNIEMLNLLGFVHYNLENYPECENANRSVLGIEPENTYSLKGLGLCLSKTGNLDEGVTMLKKSISLTTDDFLDPYHDLAVVLCENGRPKEALQILTEGRNRSQTFQKETEPFYQQLVQEK